MATKKGAEQKRRLLEKSENVGNFSDSKLKYVFYLFFSVCGNKILYTNNAKAAVNQNKILKHSFYLI